LEGEYGTFMPFAKPHMIKKGILLCNENNEKIMSTILIVKYLN
jgi:hypothetical protein